MDSVPFLIEHESKGNYRSKHVAHILTGVANFENIQLAIDVAIEDAAEFLGEDDAVCDYHISLVEDRNGQSFGYAYAWFENEAILNLLLGKNADGSDRFEMVDDPAWKPTELTDAQRLTTSWADQDEADVCPKIRQELAPLVKLESYNPNSLQIRQYEATRVKPSVRPGELKITETRFDTQKEGVKHEPNTLFIARLHESLTKEDVHTYLHRFVSDREKCVQRKGRGAEKYPLVHVTQNRNVYITFDPSTHDSYFISKVVRNSSIPDSTGRERFTVIVPCLKKAK